MLDVVDPGLLTTIQDGGRPGSTGLGVPVGGACDRRSLAVANLLLDNDPDDSALEMTVGGPTLAVHAPAVLALAGADLGGRVRETRRRLVPGRTYLVEPGATLEFPGAADPRAGARAYLAIAGGVDVPVVLGSRSTCLAGGFGGIDGRALLTGDRIRPVRAGSPDRDVLDRIWPAPVDEAGDPARRPFRVLPGPAVSLDRASLEAIARRIVSGAWVVAADSDRTGLRLAAPRGDPDGGEAALGDLLEPGGVGSGSGAIPSHGVVTGSIQVPPDGSPIVLLVDHQTTGGYPVPAVVIAADHDRLGQLRPGAQIRFEWTDLGSARAALAARTAAFSAERAAFREGRAWDELWRSTGA